MNNQTIPFIQAEIAHQTERLKDNRRYPLERIEQFENFQLWMLIQGIRYPLPFQDRICNELKLICEN